jgi:hypothetical protein
MTSKELLHEGNGKSVCLSKRYYSVNRAGQILVFEMCLLVVQLKFHVTNL